MSQGLLSDNNVSANSKLAMEPKSHGEGASIVVKAISTVLGSRLTNSKGLQDTARLSDLEATL